MQKIKTHLSRDPVMKKLVAKHELYEWPMEQGNIYEDLVSAIVGQQLSAKAANTILQRFKALFEEKQITAEQAVLLNEQQIRDVGISKSKILYIKELSKAVVNSEIDLEDIKLLPNEEVANELIKLKGIGPWTVDMILIFTLRREDVFPIGDLGIRNAMANLYNIDRDDEKELLRISKNWKPYRSYACRYLWKSLDNV